MPKILINEIDKTTPGTPDGYSNYSVLIPGFRGRVPVLTADVIAAKKADTTNTLKADKVQPDSNGVYEFSDAQDFLDVIGPVAPHYDIGGITVSHYGNQMAYELLKQGYSVVYLPIEPDTCVETLCDGNTWEIFKDKANYDFRFVYHGLLESYDASELKKLEERIGTLHTAISTLNEKVSNSEKLNEEDRLLINGNTSIDELPANNTDLTLKYNDLYSVLYNTLGNSPENDGLKQPGTDTYYGSWWAAVTGVLSELQTKNKNKNKIVTTGTIDTVNVHIAKLAAFDKDAGASAEVGKLPGRGDCIALVELDENTYVNTRINPENAIIDAIGATSLAKDSNIGKYCAMTVPSVVYHMADDVKVVSNGVGVDNPFAGNKKFPGAFHYLTCFMSSLQANYREWYAAAGYTRGVSGYSIDYATVTLGEIAINALEPRNKATAAEYACNVIANFRGSYYLWGNRTAHKLGDPNGNDGDLVASHFLNIRQLCTTIKKQLYVACRRFTFDPNSDTLWFNFVNAIRPTLELMKADQGIRDYRILKVPTDKKATLKAKIRIIPIEAVEDFDLEVSLEDSFGETTVVAAE